MPIFTSFFYTSIVDQEMNERKLLIIMVSQYNTVFKNGMTMFKVK